MAGKRKAGRPPEKEITRAQERALVAIDKFINRFGYPPTIAELAARLRVAPPSALALLKHLGRKRLIARKPGKARTIRLLKKGRDIVGSGH